MQDFVLITGNQHKVDLLTKYLGRPVRHHKADLDEIQSLDPRIVAEHKVRQAYDLLREPVLIDDVSLTFDALGRLPGTQIKWFLEELKPKGLADLASRLDNQKATASMVFALFDGQELLFFEHAMTGRIAPEPRTVNNGLAFGWNEVFIPDGSDKTFAEMDEDELRSFSHRAPAVAKLKEYLDSQK
ncbi:MAG: non-canonical purine NTP pyrophosphatase [Candidatus Saccharimonadales bacterium]